VIQISDDAIPTTDRNWLLSALPAAERAQVAQHLELYTADAKTVLAEPDQPLTHVYFPESATLAVRSALAPRGVEVGTVGCEGMSSIAGFLGANAEPLRVTCLVPGTLWRMPVHAFVELGGAGSALERVLRRYALASLLRASQAAACFGLHTLDERCARWMLAVHDCVGSTPFPLTHQQLATALGVRRAGATVAMRMLREAGAIEYTRGRIAIVDRAPLESRTCACYGIVRRQYAQLLEIPETLPA
jgi:CRP-like cAMP-binding protein